MNTELNFPRRLLAGLTALALLLMLALPVWAEGEETEKLPVSINSVEDLLQLVADCRLDSWSEDRTVDLNTDLDLTGVDFAGIPTFSGTFDGNSHTISGLSRVEVRAIRTLLGAVAPARYSMEMTPTYGLFCKLADAGFESLPTEPREGNERVTRFKFNGKGVRHGWRF